MSKVALSGNASGTGTFTIASPNSNTDQTLTLPDNTGTILTTATAGVPVNGPAFSAFRNTSDQSISATTWTKVAFNAEEFDTNSNYDNATNYRFTPTVAGYYSITWMVYLTTGTVANTFTSLYKNGSIFKYGTTLPSGAGYFTFVIGGAVLVYMNGSTDYVEVYANSGQNATIASGNNLTYFQGAMVRSAT